MHHDTRHIEISDLPEECRQVAQIIGLDNFLALVQARGGESIYIPKAERIAIAARNRAIREEFDGRNHRELARKYNLSVTWVREVLGDTHRQDSVSPHQLPIF